MISDEEKEIPTLNMCGATVGIATLSWIARELELHGSVRVINCGKPYSSNLLTLGMLLQKALPDLLDENK